RDRRASDDEREDPARRCAAEIRPREAAQARQAQEGRAMKLRTTVFLWVLLLVVAVLGTTIGTIAYVFERSTRTRVAGDLARSRVATLDLHSSRASLFRQECRVVAEEPRLKAVVATEDVARETILDAVRTLAETLRAGVFVIVDAEGVLIADSADPEAEG